VSIVHHETNGIKCDQSQAKLRDKKHISLSLGNYSGIAVKPNASTQS